MSAPVSRFACTGCGACCDRSPEVELSEAADLADTFVFQLMFRLYERPKCFRREDAGSAGTSLSKDFYAQKRHLSAFAARSWSFRRRQESGRLIDTIQSLLLSAIAIDTSPGTCSALKDRRCSLYNRRPMACRSVPLHYAQPEIRAPAALANFLANPAYECDTSATAPIIIEGGHIVDPQIRLSRQQALATAERDRAWHRAIVQRLDDCQPSNAFPTISQIRKEAAIGAVAVPLRVAWVIAAEKGWMSEAELERATQSQICAIDRAVASGTCTLETVSILSAMRREYQQALS